MDIPVPFRAQFLTHIIKGQPPPANVVLIMQLDGGSRRVHCIYGVSELKDVMKRCILLGYDTTSRIPEFREKTMLETFTDYINYFRETYGRDPEELMFMVEAGTNTRIVKCTADGLEALNGRYQLVGYNPNTHMPRFKES